MKGWYKTATNRPPPPAHIMLALITEEHVELYRRVPPHRDSITIKTAPYAIDESTPFMDKISWEVRRLWRHCLGGGGGRQASGRRTYSLG